MKSFLILEDGTVFEGSHIGAQKEVVSEIVFNTSMAGYLEVLTDPSYAGQAVCMTYPLIGNYGICLEDMESKRPWPDGFIVRELSRIPSNFRCDISIQQFLEEHGVPGIAGIDTRALTRILREKGTMNGMITTDVNYDLETIIPQLKAYTTGSVVERVSCNEKCTFAATGVLSDDGAGLRVAVLDLGMKRNIAKSLAARGCEVTVYPAQTPAAEILSDKPDGIMLSNGPGDPKECTTIIEEIRKLYESDTPVFAICLGHQLMALATGADTFKMKYGHRGGNHPVKDLATEVIIGKKIRDLGYEPGLQPAADYFAVKMPVFSFEKIRGAEISLGPEMKSTGECLGIARTFNEALYKAFLGAGINLPRHKQMIITVKDADKGEAIEVARRFEKLGYIIYATRSTAAALNEAGVKARKVNKIQQESPTVMDLILGHKIDLVIDTPTQGRDKNRDGFLIRRTSIETGVNCITAMDTAVALVTSLENAESQRELTLVDIASIARRGSKGND